MSTAYMTAARARFYYDAELVEREQQLTRWLALSDVAADGGALIREWLGVVRAEMTRRGI